MPTIEIKNVYKNYGRTAALKNVSLTFMPDKIYGLLGRNGAGKTTLLNIVTNMLFPTAGEILVDGEAVTENERALLKIFHASDEILTPYDMKVKDTFRWAKEFRPAFDLRYAYKLADKFSLDPGKKMHDLSAGYRTIVKLVLTLASGAPVMLFDEPALGLDANHRELFYKELIANYSERPKTVVISTHLIDEISAVLEEVVIIKNGEIILSRPLDEVLPEAYTVTGEEAAVDRYTKHKNVVGEETIGNLKTAHIFQKRNSADQAAAGELGLKITPAKLQELFIRLTNS
jgi:ABC-2 type transport system ATP-binding protein